MKRTEFDSLLGKLGDLSIQQRKLVLKTLDKPNAREEVSREIENNADKSCPHCQSVSRYRWGKENGLQRWRCRDCQRTYNALTGTSLSRLRKKEKWIAYSEELQNGTSIHQSAKSVGVHANTAFRWRHRFLKASQKQSNLRLMGVTEIDETYFLRSCKGKRGGLSRKARKRGGHAAKRGLSDEQVPVLNARDRTGTTVGEMLDAGDSKHIAAVLKPVVSEQTILCADAHAVHEAVASELNIPLKTINLSAGVRVVERIYHIQNVKAYDSRLKGWMARFHGVATHRLPNYLRWHQLLERQQSVQSPTFILMAAQGKDYVQRLAIK